MYEGGRLSGCKVDSQGYAEFLKALDRAEASANREITLKKGGISDKEREALAKETTDELQPGRLKGRMRRRAEPS